MLIFAKQNVAWFLALALVALGTYLVVTEVTGKSVYVSVQHSVGGVRTLTLDASKRSIISTNDSVCAEPAPDSMASLASEFGASMAAEAKLEKLVAFLNSSSKTDVVSLFQRSQGIQALRDGMYRLCEGRMNRSISSEFYEELMIDLVSTLNFIVPLELCARASGELGKLLGALEGPGRDGTTPAVMGGSTAGTPAPGGDERPTTAAADQARKERDSRDAAAVAVFAVCADLAQEFGLSINSTASERMKFRRAFLGGPTTVAEAAPADASASSSVPRSEAGAPRPSSVPPSAAEVQRLLDSFNAQVGGEGAATRP